MKPITKAEAKKKCLPFCQCDSCNPPYEVTYANSTNGMPIDTSTVGSTKEINLKIDNLTK